MEDVCSICEKEESLTEITTPNGEVVRFGPMCLGLTIYGLTRNIGGVGDDLKSMASVGKHAVNSYISQTVDGGKLVELKKAYTESIQEILLEKTEQ
jgi:Mor family transcriptional regulator